MAVALNQQRSDSVVYSAARVTYCHRQHRRQHTPARHMGASAFWDSVRRASASSPHKQGQFDMYRAKFLFAGLASWACGLTQCKSCLASFAHVCLIRTQPPIDWWVAGAKNLRRPLH